MTHLDHPNVQLFHRAHEALVTLVIYTYIIILCWDGHINLSNISIGSTLLRCCVSLLTEILVVIFQELLALGLSELGTIVNPVSLHTTVMAHHALCPALRLCESYTRFMTRLCMPLMRCDDLSFKLFKKL